MPRRSFPVPGADPDILLSSKDIDPQLDMKEWAKRSLESKWLDSLKGEQGMKFVMQPQSISCKLRNFFADGLGEEMIYSGIFLLDLQQLGREYDIAITFLSLCDNGSGQERVGGTDRGCKRH